MGADSEDRFREWMAFQKAGLTTDKIPRFEKRQFPQYIFTYRKSSEAERPMKEGAFGGAFFQDKHFLFAYIKSHHRHCYYYLFLLAHSLKSRLEVDSGWDLNCELYCS